MSKYFITQVHQKKHMKYHNIPFKELDQLSRRDKAYAQLDPNLLSFIKHPPSIQNIASVIKERIDNPITDRKLLKSYLIEQYQRFELSPATEKNVLALEEENTFTVTTAHQPSLVTGPLYFIIKIVSTLNLAKLLKEHYPDYQFVPVFVLGEEDHDFEEINHFHLFGNELVWQNEESGSVGRMSTKTLQPVLEELKEILSNSETAEQIYQVIHHSYTHFETYGDATFNLVNSLFKDDGLVILKMGDQRLKDRFAAIMKDELINSPSHTIVSNTINKLEQAGFKAQATPREINLFYLRDQLRARIERQGDHFEVVGTDLKFSRQEMLAEVDHHPERFSPNVTLRALYQELILPNLVYVGGGGELAYWMERKKQFSHYNIPFPMLLRRNSLLWIDKGNAKKMEKNGLDVKDLFKPTDLIIKEYVKENASNELSLKEEKKQIAAIFDGVGQQAKKIDPTLFKTVMAEKATAMKGLGQIEGKLTKAEKNNHEIAIGQINSVKEKLFPEGNLQERHDNFLNFYLRYGDTFFKVLKDICSPFNKDFLVVVDY